MSDSPDKMSRALSWYSKRCLVAAFALAVAAAASAADAASVLAIRDARIVRVSAATLERGTVLLRDGVIAEVGRDAKIPAGVDVIDGRGLVVYPGLIDVNSVLGLTEVPGVGESNDFSELGELNPQLLAFDAYNVDSVYVAINRLAGVTAALSIPTGGMLPGQAALMSLAGWTPEEMEVSRHAALILNYPKLDDFEHSAVARRRRPFFEPRPPALRLEELEAFFASARQYGEARRGKAGAPPDIDLRYEAMMPALEGRQTVLFDVDSEVDIRRVVQFAETQHLGQYALLGAEDAHRVAGFLAEHRVPVILKPPDGLPRSDDDPGDIVCRTPAILHRAGVRFAIGSQDELPDARSLRHDAGLAVACGLPWEAALRSVTLAPAEILGVQSLLGSIDKGKKANLVVYDGDMLEYGTQLKHVIINGRALPLRSRYTDLYETYMNRGGAVSP